MDFGKGIKLTSPESHLAAAPSKHLLPTNQLTGSTFLYSPKSNRMQ